MTHGPLYTSVLSSSLLLLYLRMSLFFFRLALFAACTSGMLPAKALDDDVLGPRDVTPVKVGSLSKVLV